MKNFQKLMDKYNLTIGDLPAFPPKEIDLEKLIIAIGEGKKKYYGQKQKQNKKTK